MRVLKHGGASSAAIEAARNFACDHCQAHKTPKSALPAQVQRVVEFNALVGVDIKYLPGWQGNQKITTVNMIDYASSLQATDPLSKRKPLKAFAKFSRSVGSRGLACQAK